MKYYPRDRSLPLMDDFFDNLPFRENRAAYITRKYGDMWNLRKFDGWNMSNSSKHSPYIRAERILRNNIGKPFSQAFSYFCRQSRINDQNVFLDYFRDTWRSREWKIDDNGLIKYTPYISAYRRNRKIIYYSDDYKVIFRVYFVNKDKLWNGKWKDYASIWDTPPNYRSHAQKIHISGYAIEFKSKKDPLYKRLHIEQLKRKEKHLEELNKQRRLIADEKFREILNAKKLKDREQDRLKMERKGFDPIHSFRPQHGG
jgi:hypothetical protein